MPRLLPRLLEALQKTADGTSKRVARSQPVVSRKRKSLYRPIPVAPSFSPAGRTHSILLDKNPMTDKDVFERHKRLPPKVRLGFQVTHDEQDLPREMTAQEREWWSSPYLRMLAAPLRQCAISKRYLPNDFLVRLAVLRSPPTTQNARSIEVLVPDGLQHPKYKGRKGHVAVYVPCWKRAVETMKSPVSLPRYGANIFFSKHLCSHVGYLLRLRVLQELEVLTGALKRNYSRIEFDADPGYTILRRLTRSEFKTLRDTDMIPYPDAVAVLIVPPVNRDPRTKLRPLPSWEPAIPSTESSIPLDPPHKKVLLPLSALRHVSVPDGALGREVDGPWETSFSTFLPNACVPQYNGVTMFPSPSHRAALYKSFMELLDVERHFRAIHPDRMTTSKEEFKRAKGGAKASHAFLLVSNEQTVKRADTAALAIALWRLRMWEGDAFSDKVAGWEIGNEWRTTQTGRR